MSSKNVTMCIDNLSVMELAVLIGGFCGEQTKYYRYGKNLKLAWKVLLKTNQVPTVYSRIGFRDPRHTAPDEAVKALKKFLKPGRISDETIEGILTDRVSRGYWKDELFRETKDQEDKHFNAFKKACVTYVNNYMSNTGIKLTMPAAKTKAASKDE